MAKPANPFDVLEVSSRATETVIKAAFRALAKVYDGDAKKMQAIVEAKDTLLDPKLREGFENPPKAGKMIGPYKLLKPIAEGGFGMTYLAEHTLTAVPVCIKHASRVSPADEALLIEEAKAVWDLRHYGLPTMRDIIKLPDGSLALVMSYITGLTVEETVEQLGGLDPENCAWITSRILNILQYLHYNGVVHGDVKSQNVILQPDRHAVVMVDFGLSLIRPTATSSAKGYTPYYAPPEQVRGQTLVPASDLYSLGITMIRMLGGSVERKSVPDSTPGNMQQFIKSLIQFDVLKRPTWDKDLCESFAQIRQNDFGRVYSGMKPLGKR
jgi:serine/threonine protein kinase